MFALLASLALAAGLAQPTGLNSRSQPAADAVLPGVTLIPRSVLFGNPERMNVQVSPDASQISYLAPLDGVLNVWVMPAAGGDARPVTRSTDRPIFSYGWAWNGEQILYSQDRGGDENTTVYAVDVATGTEIELTPGEGVKAAIFSSHRDRPDELLVLMNERNPQLNDVHRVNVRTGESEIVMQNDEGWVGFVPNDDWDIVGRVKMTATGGLYAEMREGEESDWFDFRTVPMVDAGNFGILGLSRDGDTLYMTDSGDRDTNALVAVEPGPNGGTGQRVIFASDESDVADILINPITREPEAVAVNRLRKKWTILDEAVRPDFTALDGLDDGDFEIVHRSRNDRTWVVAYLDDDGPVNYWLWDRDAANGRFLFTNRPALEDLPLAEMQAVEVPTRDGLSMPSYLTVPVGGEARNLPMVLLVHGGPWARDQWGYNPYHQWLANRGYAVLSVNFRGSTGFGKAFMNAGNREWYGKMQDDLVDAVKWAVNRGTADPDRVAIMGGSYGGYATLAGLTRDPKLFACGVDIVGPSHIATLLSTIPPYWEPLKAMFEQRVGSLDEPSYLDSISPLTHVENIERPLLIGQGANDPRVKISESDQIVDAMQQRDIPVTYVVFPDEGHGFAKPENNMAFNAVVEAFLRKHLGGRAEAIGDDLEVSTAQVRAMGDLDLNGAALWTEPEGDAAGANATANAAGGGEDGTVSLEDLSPEAQARMKQAMQGFKRMSPDQLQQMSPMILMALESELAGAEGDERLSLLYMKQEIQRMLDGGDDDEGDGGE